MDIHTIKMEKRTQKTRQLYASASHKVEEDLFGCAAENLYLLLKVFKDRLTELIWDESE